MTPSKSIVGGIFQDALGNLITGNLLLTLPQDAQITGIGLLAPLHVRIPVNGGAVASTPIWFNDQLAPGNLAYTATVYDSTGNKVYGPELWSLTGASPLNLNTLVPLLISPDPLFANPVLQNPAQAQTISGFGLTLAASAPLTVDTETVNTKLISPAIGPTSSQQHSLPAVASDTVALLAATQTLTGKTFGAATLIGALSGTGNFLPISLFNSGTGASNSTFWRGDGTWVAAGVVPIIQVDLTAQNTNCSTQTLTTPGANGFFRISAFLAVTTAAGTSSTTPLLTVNYNTAESNTAESTAISNAATGNTVGTLGTSAGANTFVFFAKSGVAITLQCASYASNPANAMQYALHARLEGPF